MGGGGRGLVFGALGKGSNKRLRVLKWAFNEVDGRALKDLVGAVKGGGLEYLQRVELNGNKFSEDDDKVMTLREILDARREDAGEDEGEGWGLDSLSDMEEESDEDEEEESEDGEEKREEKEEEEMREGKANKILEVAEQEENAPVSQKQDKEVDDLAEALEKTI